MCRKRLATLRKDCLVRLSSSDSESFIWAQLLLTYKNSFLGTGVCNDLPGRRTTVRELHRSRGIRTFFLCSHYFGLQHIFTSISSCCCHVWDCISSRTHRETIWTQLPQPIRRRCKIRCVLIDLLHTSLPVILFPFQVPRRCVSSLRVYVCRWDTGVQGGGRASYCYIQRSFNDTWRIKSLLLIMPMTNCLFILKKLEFNPIVQWT